MNKILTIITLLMLTLTTYAQREIKGTVVDDNGETLIGATVKASDSNGTVTDLDGNFKIKVSEKDKTLKVSYVGYKPRTIELAAGKSQYKIAMQLETTTIKDVVVIGYGAVKKGDVTAAVSKIDGEEIEDRPVTDVTDLMQGQLAGVEIRKNSGMPGGQASINVRGAVTLSENDALDNTNPLIVVDGIPMDEDFDLSTIEPHDIASIEVLKDASSSAIYGSQGANGVIIVTTKKPDKNSKFSISATANFSLQQVNKHLDVMSGEQWAQMNNMVANQRYIDTYGNQGAQADDGSVIRSVLTDHAGWTDANKGDYTTYRPDPRWTIPGHPGISYIDWQDEAYRIAPMQKYSVSASGSNQQSSFRVSAAYSKQDGVIRGTGYERFTATAQGQTTIDRYTFGVNVAPSISVSSQAGTGSSLATDKTNMNILTMAPVAEAEAGAQTSAYPYNYYAWASNSMRNPVSLVEDTKQEQQIFTMRTNAFFRMKIMEGLTAELTGSWNMRQRATRYFQSSTTHNLHDYNTAGGEGQSTTASWKDNKSHTFSLQALANYNKTFGKHSINAMLGWQFSSSRWADSSNSSADTFVNDAVEGYNMSTANVTAASTSYTTPVRMVSYFGRAIYNYDNRYVVNFSLRTDGSSRFGENTRWGTFPSVSAAWRISNESFWPEDFIVNQMKLRMSYGQNGRNNINSNAIKSTLSSSTAYINGVKANGFILSSKAGNPDLGWQKTNSWDFAVDFGLWKNRLSMAVDYYIKNTSSLLYQMQLAAITGYSTAYFNIGKIRNSGVDIELKSINIVKPFKWTSSLNIGFQTSKVLDLGGEEFIESGASSRGISGKTQISIVGETVGDYYLLEDIGVWKNQEEIDNAPLIDKTGIKPGMIKIRDANGDGVIDRNDRVRCGNPRPDVTIGLSNRFNWKNWELYFLVNAQFGGKIYAASVGVGRAFTYPQGNNGKSNVYESFSNMWLSEENPGDGNTPAIWMSNSQPGGITSNLYSSDYIRLQNVTLSYKFKLPKKALVRGLSVMFSIENALQWDRYPLGYSPEGSAIQSSSMSSYDLVAYPTARVYSLGVKFSM